jgi:hypothetical protein
MKKIPIEKVKKMSPKTLLKLINRMKAYLKKHPIVIDMFKEYDVPIEELDLIPMKFGELDVSARTDHGIITFSYKLLCDGNFFKDYMYAVHEITHYLQQTTGDKPTQGAEDGDYLENPFEQEGFQRQIEYVDDMFGENEADNYVEHLLDHHDVKDSDDREDKKDTLMELVDE